MNADVPEVTGRAAVTRRTVMRGAALAAAALPLPDLVGAVPAEAASTTAEVAPTGAETRPAGGPVRLHWLAAVPAHTNGVTWGVPWPRGEVRRQTTFALETAGGDPVAVQSWPLAYWPDGSLKWTGHAIGPDAGLSDQLRIAPGRPAEPAHAVSVSQTHDTVEVDTGVIRVVLPRSGKVLVSSVRRGTQETARDGQLVLIGQDAPDDDEASPARKRFLGTVERATVEQQGPVRAVVKVTGRYHGPGNRSWLPFTVRFYFYAGGESMRAVHSFIFDGDQNKDFIKGLGLSFAVPMRDEPHDRHVRFVGEGGGTWGDPVRVLSGLNRYAGKDVVDAQFAGSACPPVSDWPEQVRAGFEQLAVWNDYKLVQATADGFSIAKRTGPKGSWLRHAGHGGRASGLGYVGGVTGGVAFGLREFWQRHPSQLDIRDAGKDAARVTVWFWSPEVAAMDLRHYDDKAHGLSLAYEDIQEGFSTPSGVARSDEVTLWALSATPARTRLAELARTLGGPTILVADPEHYHGVRAFGWWSLIDRSTPVRANLEDQITAKLDFYLSQVEQRRWYGFWDYGDVMHSYDETRHGWRYDVGGFAWANGEQGPDLWLWYSFIRSGRADVFRMAEAMTRHLAEVDFHHTGRFAGLGSRHNVSHWGDGAKEARVSAAMLKRFSYYLTADELTGDWMRSALQADQTLINIEPLREILPPPKAPTRVRIGPDWTALAGNWLVEWERTGDTTWRDRIVTGMRDVGQMAYGLFSGFGGAMGFDPKTAHLTYEGREFEDSINLSMIFGGAELLMELDDLVDVPEWDNAFLTFCRLCNGTDAERIAAYGRTFKPGNFKYPYSRLMAYAGVRLGDDSLKVRAWQDLNADTTGVWPAKVHVEGADVLEPVDEIRATHDGLPGIATSDAAQRSLTIIELLELAPEQVR